MTESKTSFHDAARKLYFRYYRTERCGIYSWKIPENRLRNILLSSDFNKRILSKLIELEAVSKPISCGKGKALM